jgi:hypothetical protein
MRHDDVLGPATLRIGTVRHFYWLKGIIVAVLILNGLDASLTLWAVSTGRAEEANPLMKQLVHEAPALFVLVKTVLVGFGCYLLWRFRKKRFAIVSVFVAFLVYYAVLLYHLRAMDLRLLERLITAW